MSQRSEPEGKRDHEATYAVSVFGPEHRLTPSQVFVADRCLRRALAKRGALKRLAHLRRLGGIISAVKAGRVHNSDWGRRMAGKRGGRAMAEKNLDLLRTMAPLAWRRSAEVRALRKRRREYEGEELGTARKARLIIHQKGSGRW
jgi:hypothetical protein